MSAVLSQPLGAAPARISSATQEPVWVRLLLITLALGWLGLFLFVPLAAIFTEALRKGLDVYWASLVDPDALSAIKLTLLAALIAVPANLVFGIAASWAIAKFDFRGKQVLLTLIDRLKSANPNFLT